MYNTHITTQSCTTPTLLHSNVQHPHYYTLFVRRADIADGTVYSIHYYTVMYNTHITTHSMAGELISRTLLPVVGAQKDNMHFFLRDPRNLAGWHSVCVCVYVCISYVSIHRHVCICVCVCVCMCVYVCVSYGFIHRHVHVLCMYLSLYLSTCVSINLSIGVCVCARARMYLST